ncbi:prostaglandin E2 receptor EP4 subtype [Patella vulgata]|uniref:prostaglandin E2 receptor EP4 subtype n=1 Tax=Patella vulgata TaxID=6465 RepID=UPI00217F89DC|nr:prostaglandin E2 receptor EP4 subtype [Patella vulgata]
MTYSTVNTTFPHLAEIHLASDLEVNSTGGEYVIDTNKRNHTVMVASVLFGSGVLGNLLALFVLATSAPEQRKTLFYKLVAGLAVTDLFGTCTTSPVVISVYLNNFKWLGGMAMCHYFSFMMIFANFTTMLIVCAMSIERYICVRHPYIYHTRLTATFAKTTLIGSWILSMLIAFLPIVGLGENSFQYPRTWCFFNYTSRTPANMAFNYIYVILGLVTVSVTVICNGAVIYTLIKMTRKQNLLKTKNGDARKFRGNNKRYAEIQMVVLLIGITIVFTTSFCPLMFYVLVCQTSLVNVINVDQAGLLMVRFASFNPILDPWVYILFRREMVWKVINLIKCILRIEPKPVVVEGAMLKQLQDEEYTCLDFCWHCLSEPPPQRVNAPFSQSRASQFNRSPSYIRRMSDSMYGNGSLAVNLLVQPSPSDAAMLKAVTQSKM